MALLGRVPAGPAKGLAVPAGGEIDHQLRGIVHCDGGSSAPRALSGDFGRDDAHEIPDIMEAVELAGVELDVIAGLDRQDNVDLLERITARPALGRKLRRQRGIGGTEDGAEELD